MPRVAALVLVLASCVRPAAPTTPPAASTPPAAVVDRSPWAAMPVRVMTWTSHGPQQIGALPGAMPTLPARWYVEPIQRLDSDGLARLIGLVRSEHVPGLSLRQQAVAAGLRGLRDLPELTALIVDGSDVDGAALAAIEVPLTRLYAAHTALDDAAVAVIVARYPALEVLDLEDTAITDASARDIAKLTSLHALNLSSTALGDVGGAALGTLSQLEIIDLGNTKVGTATVAALRTLPLHEIFLDHTRVNAEIATFAALAPGLVRFDVSGTAHHPTDAELKWLAGATNLIELGVSGAKLHDPLALQFARLPALRILRVAEAPITAATIAAIAARTDFEELDLAGTPVDDAAAAAILAAPNLRFVRLDGTRITDAALAGVASPALRELYVSYTQITDAGLGILARTPGLTGLGVGNTDVGDAGIVAIAKLDALEVLVLSKLAVSPFAFAQLARLRNLERLYLDQTQADDTTLAALAPARDSLRVLHLAASHVTEAGLPALRTLHALDELTLSDTQIGNLGDLASWPRLRVLTLVGLLIDDKALPALAARTSLVTLDLSATDIRDPAPLGALPHLRTLGLAQVRLSAAGSATIKQFAARGIEVVK